MASRTLSVAIVGDASKLKKATAEAETATSKFGKQLKSAAIGIGVGALLKGAFDQAQEARKVAAQTNAVVKSTGGAAGVSAGHVDKLSNSISKAAGVDDELVASAENMILTFTHIGRAGGVFDRTTQAAVDMAAATGTDAVSAAKMLGKALNDPVAGLSKLTRAGVLFDASQKAQIKRFQEAGQVAQAQGVILAEVEKKFGGSAAATATAADHAKVSWENFLESAGIALAPAMDTAAKALGGVADGFSGLPGSVQTTTIAVVAGAAAWLKFGDSLYTAESGLTGIGKAGAVAAAGIGSFTATTAGLNALVNMKTIKSDTDGLSASLLLLGSKGTLDGELVDAYGGNLDKLGASIDKLTRKKSWSDKLLPVSYARDVKAAAKDVDAVDKSLAGMVASGHADEAKSALQGIRDVLAAQGLDRDTITSLFDDYATAAQTAGITAKAAFDGSTVSVDKQITQLGVLQDALNKNKDTLASQLDARLSLPGAQADALNAEGAYRTALANAADGRGNQLEDDQKVITTREAYARAAQRVADLEAKVIKTTGDAAVDAANQTKKQIDVWQVYTAKLGPNDPLRKNLNDYIWRLAVIETNANRARVAQENLNRTPGPGGSASNITAANVSAHQQHNTITTSGTSPRFPGPNDVVSHSGGRSNGTIINGGVTIIAKGESATKTANDLHRDTRITSGAG